MRYRLFSRFIAFFCTILLLLAVHIESASAFTWGPYRGMTTQIDIKEQDIADFAKLGGNLLRIGFTKQPLMKKEPPYEFDEESFKKFDKVIEWCTQYRIKVVIDPHTTPGTAQSTTISADDDIWQDIRYHDLLDSLWEKIAIRYHDRNNVIVGYDLLNEPASKRLPFDNGASDYNQLVKRLIKTIRKHDTNTPIIIEPPIGRSSFGKAVNRFEGLQYLDPPQDPKIVYSPHMYLPHAFTHQGVQNRPEGIQYPGRIGMQYWDKEALRKAMQPAVEWQHKYNVPIYIGEFSVARVSGANGDQYLNDVIEIFEEYGWSWSYHAWREAAIWDSEIADADTKSRVRSTDSPRLRIFREAFKRN